MRQSPWRSRTTCVQTRCSVRRQVLELTRDRGSGTRLILLAEMPTREQIPDARGGDQGRPGRPSQSLTIVPLAGSLLYESPCVVAMTERPGATATRATG